MRAEGAGWAHSWRCWGARDSLLRRRGPQRCVTPEPSGSLAVQQLEAAAGCAHQPAPPPHLVAPLPSMRRASSAPQANTTSSKRTERPSEPVTVMPLPSRSTLSTRTSAGGRGITADMGRDWQPSLLALPKRSAGRGGASPSAADPWPNMRLSVGIPLAGCPARLRICMLARQCAMLQQECVVELSPRTRAHPCARWPRSCWRWFQTPRTA